MGFSTMDSERGMGAVRGSASCTVVREDGRSTGFSTRDSDRGMEWELYGVQYREQRIEDRRDAEEPEWGL